MAEKLVQAEFESKEFRTVLHEGIESKEFQLKLSDWGKPIRDIRIERQQYIYPANIKKVDKLSFEEVLKKFRKVRQYKTADVFLTELPLEKISFTQTYWIKSKVIALEGFLRSCEVVYGQPLPFFFEVAGEGKKIFCVPPIMEQNENRYVMIDGLHRALLVKDRRYTPWKGDIFPSSVICLLVKGASEPLPVDPVEFDDMKECKSKEDIPEKREDRHKNLKPQFFRDIVGAGLV